MKQWYLSRDPNERRTLLIGALLIVSILLYTLGWQPLMENIERKQRSIAQQEDTLLWMRGAVDKITQFQGKHTINNPMLSGQPLLSTVENTAKNITRSGGTLKRIEPKGDDTVQVWLEQASFDEIIRWLDKLQRSSGILATAISIEKQSRQGTVNARITLQRG
jgi:general secretion pathway protein M